MADVAIGAVLRTEGAQARELARDQRLASSALPLWVYIRSIIEH
jgi:hypothetical protein